MRSKRSLGFVAAFLVASVGAVGAACVSSTNPPPAGPDDAGGLDSNVPGIDSSTPDTAEADVNAPDSPAGDAADSAVADAADAGPDTSDGAPPAPTPIVTGLNNPEGITVFNGNLFWVDYSDGTLSTCAAASCTPSVLVTGLTNPVQITNDGTSLFWAANTGQPAGSILSASITQCLQGATACQASVQTIGTNLNGGGDVSVDTNNVYFTAIDFVDDAGTIVDAVFSCPKTGCLADGGAMRTLVTGLDDDPSATLVYGTTLYYGEYVSGFVACSTPDCANPTPVSGPGFGVNGIAADGTNLYWCDQSAGVIYSCPLGGCGDAMAPTVIGSGFGYPNTIALDNSYVYVSDGNQAQPDSGLTRGIYRLPK